MSGSSVSQTLASFLGQKRDNGGPNMESVPKPPEGKTRYLRFKGGPS